MEDPHQTPAEEFFGALGQLVFWAIVFGILLGILALMG